MLKDYSVGGVRMLDLCAFDKALKLTWIKRIVSTNDKWGILADKYVNYKMIISTGGYVSKEKVNKTSNPFWREVLSNWNDMLIKVQCPESIEEIMNQPLWYNKNMKDKEYFNKRWFEKNIRYIRDVIKPAGGFKSIQQLNEEYNIGENFLIYGKLLAEIPSVWRERLKTESINGGTNHNPIEKLILNTKGKASKQFYEILTDNKIIPTSELKWEKLFPASSDGHKKQYHFISKIKEIRLRNFQFKIIHRILPTNSLLHKMNITQNNLCTFCNNSVETLEHLFLTCPIIEQLWFEIEKFIAEKTKNQLLMSNQDKIFGKGNENNLINHVILLTKKHIYYCRNHNLRPTLKDLLSYINTVKEIEKKLPLIIRIMPLLQRNGHASATRAWKATTPTPSPTPSVLSSLSPH